MSTVDSVSIQPIDKTTVNQICSGQVVLNLATAVKELLENSIDAGADSIQIKLEEFGSESIEVVDNGCGVEEVNFQALTLKHHTSKIKEFSDLYSVETFGFRGEALSSLCSLSDVTIVTQHRNADIGATLKFDHNGIIISNTKTLRKSGTTVRLENLFSTLPIRRTEFLKNLKREYAKMCNVLYAYGLQSRGVRITCTNHIFKSKLTTKEIQEGNVKRSTVSTIMDTKGDSLESNIASIFGVKQKQNLLKITEKTPSEETLAEFNLYSKNLNLQKFKLDGFISSCAHGCGRSSSDRQFYFINSRPVDNSKISKLVNDIYHQYNNRQDPFVVLNITVDCGSFDVNLTPDKRQILLQNEKLLLATLKETLIAVFHNIPCTLDIQNEKLSNGFVCEEKLEMPSQPSGLKESLQKFKANFNNLSAKTGKKEQIQSRIDALLKFRLTSKSLKKTSVTDATQQSSSGISKCEGEFATPAVENKLVLSVNADRNTQDSLEPNKKWKTIEMETPILLKPTVIIEEGVHGASNGHEGGINGGETEEEINSCQSNENKRKLLENFESEIDILDESEQNESKRMKFDKGLREEEKAKRKTFMYKVTFSDIKELSLRKSKNDKTESNVKVKFMSEIKPQNNARAENELKKELKKENFKEMEIIGQFNLGFIITKLDSDIFIIDQHASDEKYNYETLQLTTVIQTQNLFNPEKLELTVDKEELMLQHKDIFKKNGFDFIFDKDAPSNRRISLTSIPMSKNYIFGKEDIDELLFLLEDAPEVKSLRPSRVNSMFASRACRKSVMIGTPLNQQEMRKVVDHMGEIEHPWNCPHGRPTMRHLVNLDMIRVKK